MIDYNTVVIYGWKVEDDVCSQFENELDKICEEIYHKDKYDLGLDTCLVSDTMCGNYIYFGILLGSYDSKENNEIIVNDKLLKEKSQIYNNKLNKYPEVKNIFEKYSKNNPQLYIFQNIW